MTAYAVWLHAVNVGGNRTIPMAQLRELAGGLGYDDVSTHLASGNLLLSSDEDAETLAAAVGGALADEFGHDVACTARSVAQLAATLEANPLAGRAGDPSRQGVVFCRTRPAAAVVEDIATWATAPEALAFDGLDAHLWAPAGFATTEWTKARLARQLGVDVTVRNWRTVTAVHDKLAALPDAG